MGRKSTRADGPGAGDLVRELRERVGLSQRQTVDGTKLSSAALSRIESGERRLGVKSAIALSKKLPLRVVVESGRARVERMEEPAAPLYDGDEPRRTEER